jgi:hypothetical protein
VAGETGRAAALAKRGRSACRPSSHTRSRDSLRGRFVSSVADSLLEAVEEPDGRALYWAIYAEETPVGFVMISDEASARRRST